MVLVFASLEPWDNQKIRYVYEKESNGQSRNRLGNFFGAQSLPGFYQRIP